MHKVYVDRCNFSIFAYTSALLIAGVKTSD